MKIKYNDEKRVYIAVEFMFLFVLPFRIEVIIVIIFFLFVRNEITGWHILNYDVYFNFKLRNEKLISYSLKLPYFFAIISRNNIKKTQQKKNQQKLTTIIIKSESIRIHIEIRS